MVLLQFISLKHHYLFLVLLVRFTFGIGFRVFYRVKIVRILSFSGPYFRAFGPSMEI